MLADQITDVRVQNLIADWKNCLAKQLTTGTTFGIIELNVVDSPEVKQAIEYFFEKGFVVTIKRFSWWQRALDCAAGEIRFTRSV